MKYFLDTEFIEAPNHLDLISIGIVSEGSETLYLENSEVDWSRASNWVLTNVRPHLQGDARPRIVGPKAWIAEQVRAFVGNDPTPEFWADYAAYDWVALCWLFGTMMDLPKGWPMFCRDIQQVAHGHYGETRPPWPPRESLEHNALADALDCRNRWAFLNSLAPKVAAVSP